MDNSSDHCSLPPSSTDPHPPLPPLVILGPHLPLALAAAVGVVTAELAATVVAMKEVAAMEVAALVVVVVAEAVNAATVVVMVAAVAVVAVRLHRPPVRAGAALLGRPSTTTEPTPSTCGRARPGGHMPCSLHCRWGLCFPNPTYTLLFFYGNGTLFLPLFCS
jgi:hypothetical protein